jgi:secreted trypsin-like serine protease
MRLAALVLLVGVLLAGSLGALVPRRALSPATVGLVDRGAVVCSGVLVANRVVVTAAHCVDDGYGIRRPQVFLGTAYAPRDATVRVREVVVHTGFRRPSMEHDLAVVVLDGPVTESFAQLRLQIATPVETRGAFAGFGDRTLNARGHARLREGIVELRTVTEGAVSVFPVSDSPCHGDSGGPLFIRADEEVRVLGVLSNGDPYCQDESTYTRFTERDVAWIRSFIER